jgi:hypothetical protein
MPSSFDQMPRNLSWLIPDRLAGLSLPTRADQLAALHSAMGVHLLVTVMDEPASAPLARPLFASLSAVGVQTTQVSVQVTDATDVLKSFQDAGFQRVWQQLQAAAAREENAFCNLHVPVPNYQPPSVSQIDVILATMEAYLANGQNRRVAVHCGGGKGIASFCASLCFIDIHFIIW